MLLTDDQYFEKVFREYYSLLCNYAGKYIVDSQVCEDIAQDFFITIWEKKHLSVTADSFLPYAYRAIKNSCINYYKVEMVKENYMAVLTREWSERLEEEEEFIYKKEVREALSKLPEKCRKVFLLKCVSGLKYKEIAEVTGISVHTVKYHITEAFCIMREELEGLALLLFFFFS